MLYDIFIKYDKIFRVAVLAKGLDISYTTIFRYREKKDCINKRKTNLLFFLERLKEEIEKDIKTLRE